ncbi:putative acyl-activating enzyme 5, peroxisomal [Platanthera guangdongensis]|uniref:Acyl-activating enzyme 5, peroxisomal n=1 Tax=Platanthera guangdongensis TaxID=2320717 RepID=A0ABR2MVY7_9ASPA
MDVVSGETGRGVSWEGVTMGGVVLSGEHVMLGYLKDEETTAKTIKDGWFFTDDVGVMHCDGYLEIKDRSKDVIISGGENISSVEVESLMYEHLAVNEAAVEARPDDFWGETPCAFVGLKAGLVGPPPTEAEVIAWCREKMSHFIVPKTVVFLSELPKTSPGKIQEYWLRTKAKKLVLSYNQLKEEEATVNSDDEIRGDRVQHSEKTRSDNSVGGVGKR